MIFLRSTKYALKYFVKSVKSVTNTESHITNNEDRLWTLSYFPI